ncbi:MAG: gluconeogenesis factor YvcK family protein [Acidimicrobiia bacterium]
MSSLPRPDGPAVVALGGGHGLAVALRAVRRYAGSITAVVSMADDGGSSGRLRRELGVPPPGDLRKCLVALADDRRPWNHVFEHRFAGGELEGHALGNLVLAGLVGSMGDLVAALDEAADLLHAAGRVLPATTDAVVLKADVDGGAIEGQVAVSNTDARIRRVELVPRDAPACPDAVSAVKHADQVVLAPGSLYTSVVPVLCVADLRRAVAETVAPVVQVANLRPQVPETAGLDATDHLRAVVEHGGRVGSFLYQENGELEADDDAIRDLGARPVAVDVACADGHAHDPERLAVALSAVV